MRKNIQKLKSEVIKELDLERERLQPDPARLSALEQLFGDVQRIEVSYDIFKQCGDRSDNGNEKH